MLTYLWLTLQCIVVLLSADVDALVPQSPAHLLILALLGAALLSPIAPWAARSLIRVLARTLHGPEQRSACSTIPDFRLPEAPGTPGTALVRAPSNVVRLRA